MPLGRVALVPVFERPVVDPPIAPAPQSQLPEIAVLFSSADRDEKPLAEGVHGRGDAAAFTEGNPRLHIQQHLGIVRMEIPRLEQLLRNRRDRSESRDRRV